MSTRDEILERIRRGRPAPTALPQMPGPGPREDLLVRFRAGVERMGGKVVDVTGDPAEIVRQLHPKARIVCSAAPEVATPRRPDPAKPAALDDVDVGVVRAAFGVAETGSVWIDDTAFVAPALGFLAQHLVVLLDPSTVVADMHEAYAKRAHFEASYGVFMTGPSATADIEGILIHGAQGVRSLTVVLAG